MLIAVVATVSRGWNNSDRDSCGRVEAEEDTELKGENRRLDDAREWRRNVLKAISVERARSIFGSLL